MSSELQKQVSALKAKQVQVEPLQKGRKSLFLNPKEAAAIDVETVYDTAAQALGILSQYDNRFDDYKNTLLHPSSIQVRRELKTTEENNELNLQLSSLLKLLTLFIHNKYSHQIMEYLIRRYRVNEMNISDYILCVLPIHDSKLFARALQICTLDKNSIWSYLDGVKSSGSPLPRNALVRQCQVNSELIRVLAMSAVSSVNLALDRSNYNALSITFIETILAQFTSIVVDLVSAAANTYQTTLADNQLRAVCVFLFPALKCYVNRAAGSKVQLPAAAQLSLLRVWLRAGYTILLNITGRTKLSVLFLHVIAATLIGTVQSSLAQCISLHGAEALSEMIGDESSIHYEALHVLSRACTDEKFLLTEELLVILFDDDSITNSLFLMLDSLRQRLEKQVYVQPFCDCLARSLLEILIAHAKKISNSNTDHVSSLVISIPALCRTLCVKGFVSTTCVGAVIKTLLTQFTKCTFSVASESVIASNNKKKSAQSTVSSPSTVASSLLLLFSKYEPELFDSIVQELNQDLATDILHQQNLIKAPTSYLSLQDVLSVVFAKLPYHAPADDSLSLLLSLTSPSVVTRTAALLRFSTTVPTEPFTDTDDSGLQNDLEGIASAALQCLDEKENIELIKVAWSEAVFVRISAHLSPSLLLARCIDSVSFWLECQKLRPVESYVVLSIIFSSISHKRIMSNLVSTSVDGTNTQKGFDWLFVTLLTVLGDTSTSFHAAGNKDESSATAVAKATKGKGKIASKTQETSANSVIAAAIKCAQSFASVSPLLTAFDTARQASSTYNAVFASCITSSLLNTATSSEVLRLLYSIVQLSHNNIMKSGNNYSWVATTLHILVAIAKDLKTSTDEKGRVSLNLLLSIFVPLVVRVLMSKHVDATLHLATKSIRTLLEIIGNALVTYWDIVVETVLPVSSDETPLRLLSLLLATSQDGGKDLLPLCFQTFFPSSNIIQLLRIACTGDSTTHRIQPSDAKPFVPRSCSDHLLHCDGLKRLHVSSATRIGALKCVEAWLEAVSSHKDIFVLLSSQNLNPFSLSVATAIGACADSNVYIRECGLNICSRIAALPTLVVASKKANLLALKLPALLTAASSVTSAVSTLGDLVAISDVLSSRSSEIKMDATTTVEALRNGVVSDESKSNAQTRVLLLTIAAHFSTVNVIPILALPILRAASNCSLSISWEYVKCILNYYHDQCTIIGSIDNSSLITSTAASLNNISSTDSSLQSHICDFICSLISTGRSSLVLSSLESVLTTEWIASLSLDSTRERLFSHTFDICTQNRSDSTSDIIVRSSSIAQKLMERVKVSPKLIVESFQSKVALAMVSHAALLKKFPSTGTGATATLITQDIDDEDDVDNSNTENEFTSEMNKVNLVVNKILETVFASLKLAIGDSTTAKVENVTITYLCLCYKVGLELLNALNDDRLDAGFDYTRTLITDLLSFCLEASGFLLFDSMVAGDNLVSNTISSVAAKPSKKLSKSATLTAAQTTSNYGSNPTKISLEKDITILLRSLSLSNALQTQASCLQLLKHTVQANPIIGPLLIAQLGKFLATTAILEDTVGKDSLIRELLSTCLLTSTTTTQQLTKGISATEVRRVMPQSTVQSLLLHCAGMSTSTRERLLQICLEALGPCSLPACIATLLMHVMVSYEPEGLRSLQSADKDVTILLSISAQRKARRLLQTSLPEEMFRLAMQASLRLPFEIQIFTLITLLEQAHFLLEYISESSESTMIAKSTGASSNNLSGDEEGATTSYQMSSVKLSDGSYMLLDGMLLQEYVSTLTTISQVDSNVSAMQVDGVTDSLPVSTQRGQMATLTLLLLQFIAETIENKSFQFFVNTQMKNAVGDIQNHVVQTSFLQFSDKLLQVYALASNTLLKYTKENDELFAVNIGSELLEINKASVGKVVSSSCFEILRSLQALLDIPTFITIFQELLAHHDISVRQKAFDMLTSRLEALDMSTKASFVEVSYSWLLD